MIGATIAPGLTPRAVSGLISRARVTIRFGALQPCPSGRGQMAISARPAADRGIERDSGDPDFRRLGVHVDEAVSGRDSAGWGGDEEGGAYVDGC